MNIVYTAMDRDLTEDMIDHSERFYKLTMLYIYKLSLLPSKIMLYLKYSQVILYLSITMLLFVLVFITKKSLNTQQLYKIIIVALVISIITTLVLLLLKYKLKNIIEEEYEADETISIECII